VAARHRPPPADVDPGQQELAGDLPSEFLGKWQAYAENWSTLNPYTLGVGPGSLALIVALWIFVTSGIKNTPEPHLYAGQTLLLKPSGESAVVVGSQCWPWWGCEYRLRLDDQTESWFWVGDLALPGAYLPEREMFSAPAPVLSSV
jgi:hypothetical protein